MSNKYHLGVMAGGTFTNVISAESDDFWEFVGGQPSGFVNSYSTSTSNEKSGFLTEDSSPPNIFAADLRIKSKGTWVGDQLSFKQVSIRFDGAGPAGGGIYGYVHVDILGGPSTPGNFYEEGFPGSSQGTKTWALNSAFGDMTGSQIYLRILCEQDRAWVSARNISIVLG